MAGSATINKLKQYEIVFSCKISLSVTKTKKSLLGHKNFLEWRQHTSSFIFLSQHLGDASQAVFFPLALDMIFKSLFLEVQLSIYIFFP